MRKSTKRLKVSGEVVRALAGAELAQAAGRFYCSDTCVVCDTLTWQGNTCTTPAAPITA